MFPGCLLLRQPPAVPRALRFPQTLSIPRAPGVSHPRGLERARVRTPGLGSNSAPPSLLSASCSGPRRPGSPSRNLPTRCPNGLHLTPGALGHRLGPDRLAPPSAPPSAPAGHGRSGPRAAAARSLPASGQPAPAARPAVREPPPAPVRAAALLGWGWRCGSGSGSGRLWAQQPGGLASAPRSRSASV